MLFKVLVVIALSLVKATRLPVRDYDSKQYFVVEIDTSKSNGPLRNFIDSWRGKYEFEHPVHGLDDHFVFSVDKSLPSFELLGNYNQDGPKQWKREHEDYDMINSDPFIRSIAWMEPRRLEKRMPVPFDKDEEPNTSNSDKASQFVPVDASQQPVADAMQKFDIHDPIFPEQWHLINTNYPGNDVNVTGLWEEGITGKGVVTCVIDDGLDCDSEDLKDNFNAKGSWDFNDNTELPRPRLVDDHHGTRCAGEIAAVKNEVCGVGVAFESNVAGVRILSGSITDDQEASAMLYGMDTNDIYSCSWGPRDDGKTMGSPPMLVKKAMIKAIQEGRDKKGSVYVFASGNGGRMQDSCNFDGYTNSIYSITVGAIDHRGLHPSYAEACSAVMVVTYSSGSREHIHTTDIKGKCSAGHGGTSAAAPLAAGIFALVLQANPNLTWRDVQYVCAMSAVPVNEDDGHYQLNGLGKKYSHKYGYGKIDAYKMVKFAQSWKNVKPQSWYYSDVIKVNESISGDVDSSKVIKKEIEITEDDLKVTNLERVEHITLTVDIDSTVRGKVGLRLKSPFGVVSDLATFRPGDINTKGMKSWTFMSVAHWGESGVGKWEVELFTEKEANGVEITFNEFQLRLFGEAINPDKTEVYDIMKDYAAERRDMQSSILSSASFSSTTTSSLLSSAVETSISSSTEASESLSETSSSPAVETSKFVSETVLSSKILEVTPTDATHDNADKPSNNQSEETEVADDDEGKELATSHYGQYFMALAVLGFVIVIIFMIYNKTPGSSRRRRREEYEFDIIPGEDYTDSDNDEDSLDLGAHRRVSDEERDRLYDEFNADTLPVYEDDMFKIGDEEDYQPKTNKEDFSKDKQEQKSQPQEGQEGEGSSK